MALRVLHRTETIEYYFERGTYTRINPVKFGENNPDVV